MEEEGAVKAPVTRLRRQLAGEQADDVSSPSAPSTPTKKRSARLAAKPQLDNIDENAPVNRPARVTRRASTAPDSNDPEEKPMTPSRRASARVRSTSITSDVAQSVDSPRAKRAMRRGSFAGSDTEAAVTPARQTRRTRKDSNSSVENAEPAIKPVKLLLEDAISEEPESRKSSSPRKSLNTSVKSSKPESAAEPEASKTSSPNVAATEAEPAIKPVKLVLEEAISEEPESRKSSSPRKSLNTSVKSSKPKSAAEPEESKTSSPNVAATEVDSPGTIRKSNRIAAKQVDASLNKSGNEMNTSASQNKTRLDNSKTKIVDESTEDIIKEFDAKSKDTNWSKNPVIKCERLRTSSWAPASETLDVSDKTVKTYGNRSFNKKQRLSNSVGAGDAIVFETSVKSTDKADTLSDAKENIHNVFNSSGKKRKNSKNKSFESDNDSTVNLKGSQSMKSDETEQIDDTDTVDYLGAQQSELHRSAEVLATEKFLQQSDGESIKCSLFVEDTDSNAGEADKVSQSPSVKALDGDDQCVPVVNHDMNEPAHKADTNTSCEPMDVDVTIPDDLITNFNTSMKDETVNQSDSQGSRSEVNATLNKSSGSKVKQDFEKTANENKSTLILSQIKDDSAIETNVSKSSNKDSSNPRNSSLSKKGKESNNNSLAEVETPLKNKNIKKLGIQTSTPVTSSNEAQNMEQSYSKNTSNNSKGSRKFEPSESSSSEEESSDDDNSNSKLIIDEAEDAGDDYESGDSQDESERRYIEENKIVEKGETLGSSEEDFSEDSDYEKDSFIVSSDVEDSDLLSGSGDDLSLSANELTMSAKSKKKFNEKKRKEQKSASREMFAARHQKDSQDDSEDEAPKKEKKKRMRLESANNSSADESLVKTKKNKKRLRLDSSHDSNLEESDHDDTNSKKKKKKLNKSSDIASEHEITAVVTESIIEKTDPLKAAVKLEPKTPQKLDISTVNISARYEMEEVDVNDMTVMKAKETSDPLQTTMACGDDYDSSLSENEEINQNYESILSQLNTSKNKHIKDRDISLNLNKKSKSVKEPIVDQLNLTQTKNTKKTRKESVSTKDKKSKVKSTKLVEHDTSFDMKLLFSDDGEENDHDKTKNRKSLIVEENDLFFPLKKSEGKTDLRSSLGATNVLESKPTSGSKKKKKSMSLEYIYTLDSTTVAELPENYDEDMNISQNKKTKKNKLLSLSEDISEPIRKNKKNKNSQSESEDTNELKNTEISEDTEIVIETQPSTASSQKKKKNKQSMENELPQSELVDGMENLNDGPASVSVSESKKKKTSESSNVKTDEDMNISQNKKTKKNKLLSLSEDISEPIRKNKKNKNSQSESEDTNELKNTEISEDTEIVIETQPSTASSQKKKKNKQSMENELPQSELVDGMENLDDGPASVSVSKSKKKKTSESSNVKTEANVDETGSHLRVTLNKRKRSLHEVPQQDEVNDLLAEGSREKKRLKKATSLQAEIIETVANKAVESVKEKRDKHSKNNIVDELKDDSEPKSRKRRKKRAREEDDGTMVPEQSVFNNIRISRLPTTIIDQLDAKSKDGKKPTVKAAKIVSTSAFTLEETTKRKNKPSQYLEESIFLSSTSPERKKRKTNIPKVLPFMPTVATSSSGFTTNFQVNVLSKETKFVAQLGDLPNFKSSRLQGKNVKKNEMYKRYRNVKMSKF